MTSIRLRIFGFMLAAVVLGIAMPSQAQNGDKFRARLSPVPALGISPASVAGVGSASASLSGRKLTVTGKFENMASPATTAHLCLGPLTGARGSSVFDLTVSRADEGKTGTIAGNVDLTPEQVDALKKGRFYIQIHSEGAPNGHLLGWLLK
jgi:hypothetical protein